MAQPLHKDIEKKLDIYLSGDELEVLKDFIKDITEGNDPDKELLQAVEEMAEEEISNEI